MARNRQSAPLSRSRDFEPVAQRSGAPVERPKAMKVARSAG